MLDSQLVFKDKEGNIIKLRVYRSKDRIKLRKMYEEYDPKDRSFGLPPASVKAIEAWLDYLENEGYSIIAEFFGKVVGHLAMVPFNDDLELCIFIAKDFQNKGIGQKMLSFAIELAKKLDYKGIVLTTEKRNKRAIHVFKNVGFEVVGEETGIQMYLPLH